MRLFDFDRNFERLQSILDVDQSVYQTLDDGSSNVLPARPDDLVRIRLDLVNARWNRAVHEVRERIAAEEIFQRHIKTDHERLLGALRRDADELAGNVARLEARLERLEYADRPLSDNELDDEEFDERAESAAFWAEWRQQREERQNTSNRKPTRQRKPSRRNRNSNLRQLYRRLARLIHPDLAFDEVNRAHRESVMRLANMAFEAGDEEQLQRLMNAWSEPERDQGVSDIQAVRGEIERLKQEVEDLTKQLRELERSEIGRLARADARRQRSYVEREHERLRRDVASLRLRRRRLLRALDARRQELSEVSD
jgi:polyhydroxyalkanoate synthesis regulator phasin